VVPRNLPSVGKIRFEEMVVPWRERRASSIEVGKDLKIEESGYVLLNDFKH
jgi:hypothetical protein